MLQYLHCFRNQKEVVIIILMCQIELSRLVDDLHRYINVPVYVDRGTLSLLRTGCAVQSNYE